jgi:putative isomerase
MANITDLQRRQWNGGRLMAFSGIDGPTDFYNGLTARSVFDYPGIDIKLPGPCQLVFPVAEIQAVILASDFFIIQAKNEQVRGAFLDAYHFLIEGPCTAGQYGPEIMVKQEAGRTLVGSALKFDPQNISADLNAALAARRAWLEQIPVQPDLSAAHQKALTGAISQVKSMVYAPEGIIQRRFTTPDRWPHRGMWLWDSAFHAIGIRHLDAALAREILEAVFDGQHPDGMVPIRTDPDDRSAVFTQPPILALAAALIEAVEPDPDWLQRIYPKLAAYIRWDLDNRDSDGFGLAEWAIEEHENCRSGESGWDNSPRFDTATQLDAVDFNSFLALECDLLAGFAASLGFQAEAQAWQNTHQYLCDRIRQRLWYDQAGFFVDYDVSRGEHSPVLAASGFLPLICGAATKEQVDRLAEHLHDPNMFATAFSIPTIAAQDTAHYQKDMWRGPVWININWLIAYGFERCGRPELAQQIRARTTAEIEKFYDRYATFFEFYDDRQEVDPPMLMRKGKLAPHESPFHQVFFDYGWTATLYIDLVCAFGE